MRRASKRGAEGVDGRIDRMNGLWALDRESPSFYLIR